MLGLGQVSFSVLPCLRMRETVDSARACLARPFVFCCQLWRRTAIVGGFLLSLNGVATHLVSHRHVLMEQDGPQVTVERDDYDLTVTRVVNEPTCGEKLVMNIFHHPISVTFCTVGVDVEVSTPAKDVAKFTVPFDFPPEKNAEEVKLFVRDHRLDMENVAFHVVTYLVTGYPWAQQLDMTVSALLDRCKYMKNERQFRRYIRHNDSNIAHPRQLAQALWEAWQYTTRLTSGQRIWRARRSSCEILSLSEC